ncbi:hypothetical protein IPM19_00990 [bacterium]|nr:MAG: hypothetical protein IPM19_00990 [bacterium]
MGIFREIFGGSEKNAEFVAPEQTSAAETKINPENKQEILPDSANFTAETGKAVASVETVEEIPEAKNGLEALLNMMDRHNEELPTQN